MCIRDSSYQSCERAFTVHGKCLENAYPPFNLIFFDHMNFQKVKINGFNKAVLIKTCLRLAFEFIDVLIQPNRISQIEFMADLLQSCLLYTSHLCSCRSWSHRNLCPAVSPIFSFIISLTALPVPSHIRVCQAGRTCSSCSFPHLAGQRDLLPAGSRWRRRQTQRNKRCV